MSHLSQFLTLGFPQYCSCGLPHIITNQTTLLTPVLDRYRPAIYTYLYIYLLGLGLSCLLILLLGRTQIPCQEPLQLLIFQLLLRLHQLRLVPSWWMGDQ